MSRLRVVNLGLPKSGTTTVARALRRASLHTADYRIRTGQSKDNHILGDFVGQLVYEAFFRTGDPLAYLDEFDAFSELSVLRKGLSLWPQMDFAVIDAIRQNHPGVKFFASWRPVAEISDSMSRWSNLTSERLPKNQIPGLPRGFGGADGERQRWIAGHYDHLDQIFAGSEDFLRLDVGAEDAPQQLADFIGRDVPWWGHLNRNPVRVETPDQDDTGRDDTGQDTSDRHDNDTPTGDTDTEAV